MVTPLLFCILPRLVFSSFLHTGCTVKNVISTTTFEDSLVFHMSLPFTHYDLRVSVRQGDETITLVENYTTQGHFQHQWEKLTLVMRGRLQLVLENGTVWLENNNTMMEEPLKHVKVRGHGGTFFLDCPQGMPNWCLRKGSLGLKQVLERGSRETFSFLPTGPASPSFSVGQTAIVLCWDTKANTSILVLSPTCANGLHSVPAFNWITLQFFYNDWDSTVEIQNKDEVQLIKFYATTNNQDITFHTQEFINNLYVVHHLNKIKIPLTINTTSCYINIWLWVGVSVVGILLLLLLLTLHLALVFRQRWLKNSEALILLKKGPPVLPSCFENDGYLVPGEMKEHIYQSLESVRYTTVAVTNSC